MTELTLGTSLTHEQRENLEIVRASAQSLLSLLSDILDLSTIQAGRLTVDVSDFDVRHLVDDTVRSFATRAHQKRLEVAYHVARDVPHRLAGDPILLRRVIANLLSNAVKFTGAGEVVVRVTREPSDAGAVPVVFEVADTGIGIPVEKQGTIFNVFTQADGSSTRRFGGSGLGLTMVSQLLELMGGSVALVSRPNHGSTFRVTLPLALAQADEPAAPHEDDLQAVPLLIVDNNSTSRWILMDVVSEWGMRATAVDSVDAALRAVTANAKAGDPFAVALVDYQMPGAGGLELVARLRQLGAPSPRVVLMLASTGDGQDRERCVEARLAVHFNKPAAPAVIRQAIVDALAEPAMSNVHLPAAPARFQAEPAFRVDEILDRVQGDWALLVELIEILKGEAPRLLADIERSFNDNDARGLQRAAHQLRGSVASLGATAASAEACALEKMGRDGTLANGRARIDRLNYEVHRLISELAVAADGAHV
jgi:CheY-like chemotaxis protein/HPt (histidine-containing phosphotransfer) domain-containing protein/two-component sensor histidine kinase